MAEFKNPQAIGLLLLANIIASFSHVLTMLAISWYFVNTLNKGETLAYIYIFGTVISIFWGLYSGILIDKYSRKKIFNYTLITLTITFLLIIIHSNYTNNFSIYSASIIFIFILLTYSIYFPNLYSFAQEITVENNYGRVNSLIEISAQITNIFSALTASILLIGSKNNLINVLGFNFYFPIDFEAFTINKILIINCITYLIALILFNLMKYEKTHNLKVESGSIYERLVKGFSFLIKNKKLFYIGNASYNMFVVIMVEIYLLLPIYIKNHLLEKADSFAKTEFFLGIGALLCAIFIRKMFKNVNYLNTLILLMIAGGISYISATFINKIILFYIIRFFIGYTNAGIRIYRMTYIFNEVPNNYIGRVNSVFATINLVLRTIFIALFSISFFTNSSNIKYCYLISGIFLLLSIVPVIYYKNK